MSNNDKRTFVYIDGFNFYYGSLRKSPHKWLDPRRLCCNLLQSYNKVENLYYFTARVKDRKSDPTISTRQDTYFRALKTLPKLEIIEGHYLSHPTYMQLVNPPLYRQVEIGFKTGTKYQPVNSVEVIKTEEKGSDVNLSTQILLDAFDDRFDVAVIISNDSDLATPVKFVRTRFNKRVIILNPHSFDKRSKELSQYAAKTIEITQDHIAESQFPNPIDTGRFKIYKPQSW